ncbi:MAG TPA: phosphotransferase family protein [Candidatus Dormibacteraeota bacterium]|jgi:aminoglycoside phosphotransferase (APT) family kinase protein|nr:phosphotransferase family protein [Candidatus Dormibacteraeota bacterium]
MRGVDQERTARIERELGAVVPGIRSVAPMPEGHSGFSYRVSLERGEGVLRLPPPGVRVAGPTDVARQGRLMAALAAQGMPVPAVIAVSEEPVVDGRPFVLVEWVDGDRAEPAMARLGPSGVASAASAALHELQRADVAALPMAGDPPMSLADEIARWTWLLERAAAPWTEGAERLAEALRASMPGERPPVLVHADYHYANLLFGGEGVAAVLDWEIAHVGQPLIDLACLAVAARPSGDGIFGFSPEGAGRLLEAVPDDELASIYGADVAEFRWYVALGFYEYCAILAYNLMLHLKGRRPDPIYVGREWMVGRLLEVGLERVGGL